MDIEALNKDHDRNGFDCGNSELNSFLKKMARQASGKNLSRTFVLVYENDPTIFGFVSITPCSVNVDDIPEKQRKKYPPQHGLPAIRLARLAVGKHDRGKGFGEVLLLEAMRFTAMIAESVGGIGLFVDAEDEKAKSFYERYGFVVTTPAKPMQLFMPLHTIIAMLRI